VGGGFTSVDSNPTGYIVKLDQTGVVSITDPLPLGTGFDNTILGLYYESDYNNTGIEAIIVGGVFFNYDSNSTSRVTALTLEPVPTPELNALELHVGEPEVLVVTAFTENRFEAQGYSETYGDIVEFNPMCNTISIPYYNGIYDGVTLPDSSILSGFDLQWDGQNAYFMMPAGYPILFGHFLYIEFDSGPGNFYYFFEDPILPGINYNKEDYGVDAFNFSAPYITISNDGTKVTLHGVTYQQFLDYTPGSLYLDVCIESFGAAYGYMTRRIDTTHQIDIPLDWRNFKYRRFEFVTTNVLGTTFISTNTGDTCSIPTVNSLTTGAYSDFPVIPSESFDVTITGYGGTTGYWFWSGNVENIASNQGGLMQNVHIKPGYMQNVLLDYTANVDIIASNIVVSTTRTLSNLNSLGECNINNIIIDNITSCTVGNISMASINTIVYTIFSYTVNITGDLTGSVNFGTSNFSKRILKDSIGNTLLEYFDGTTMQYVTSPF
jgi:hypothetical protein